MPPSALRPRPSTFTRPLSAISHHSSKAAFNGKFREAEACHVDVEEPEHIIDNLLRHVYELEVPLLKHEPKDDESRAELERRVCVEFEALLCLQTAADKARRCP